MAHCVLTPENHATLLNAVTKFLVVRMEKKQKIDVREITEAIYKGLEKRFIGTGINYSDAQIQALEYARHVPFNIYRIAIIDESVMDYLENTEQDDFMVNLYILAKRIKKDNSFKEVQEYLGLTDDLDQLMTVLNTGVPSEQPLPDEEEDPVHEEPDVKVKKPIDTKTTAWTPFWMMRITPKVGEYAEVIYRPSGGVINKKTKKPYKYFLKFKIRDEEVVGPEYREDGGILDADIIDLLAIENDIATKRVFVKITVSEEDEGMNRRFQFRLASEDETKKILGKEKAIEEEIERNRIAKENAKKQASDEKILKKSPPLTSDGTSFDYIAVDIYRDFYKNWEAVVPTLFSTVNAEAAFIDPITKKVVGGDIKENRIPREETKFFYGVQRYLVNLMKEKNTKDSSILTMSGYNGYMLTAMTATTARDKYKIELDTYYDDKIIMLLTDKNDRVIYFNQNFHPVSKKKDGKPSYYELRDLSRVYYSNGTIKENSVQRMSESLAALQTGKKAKDLTAQELLNARAHIFKEAKFLDKVRNYILKNNTVEFKINGGSLGFIQTSAASSQLTPFSELADDYSDLRIEVALKTALGRKQGVGYVTSNELYGFYIEIEKPGIPETNLEDTLLTLLTEDIKTPLGKSITYEQREEFLKNYLDIGSSTSVKGTETKKPKSIIISVSKENPSKHVLVVENKLFKLNTQENILAAKEAIQKVFNAKRGPYYAYRLHIPKVATETQFIMEPVITTNENGEKIVTTKQTNTLTYLKKYNYKVHTNDIAADKKLRRTSAYFTFELSDKGNDELFGTVKENVEELDKQIDNTTKTITKQKKVIPPTVSTDTELNNDNPAFRDVEDARKGKLNKNLNQKFHNAEVTEKQMTAALVWYESSPLKDKIPFKVLFNLVNSVDKNSIAEWTTNGIILWKGSDYTDIYHEAWHGFTQGFLTIDEKKALYAEVAKKSGSFRDHNGQYVTFANASAKQIEEYLAENFRQYMLTGQKPMPNSTKQNTFFRKLFNVLKALFSDATLRDIILDGQVDAKIYELYEKLKVGNIKEYTFSEDNYMFGELRQGIISKNKPETGPDQLNYQDSKMVVEMIDQLLIDYVKIRNANLTPAEIKYKTELEAIPEDKRTPEQNADLKTLNDNKTYKYTSSILKDKKTLLRGYVYVKFMFDEMRKAKTAIIDEAFNRIYELSGTTPLPESATTEDKVNLAKKIYDSLNKKTLSAEDQELINPSNIRLLLKDQALLTFVIDNFGDLSSIEANKPTTPGVFEDVIAYHIVKTDTFLNKSVKLDFEDMSETDILIKGRQAIERHGNESSLKDLASAEILYLLKSLSKYEKVKVKDETDKEVEKWQVVTNRFGIRETALFSATWNRIVRALENTLDFEEMYIKLQELGKTYPSIADFIEIMGKPQDIKTLPEQTLWTKFFQTFNKTRVPLIQLTITEEISNGEVSYASTVGEAYNADKAVGKRWNDEFTTVIFPASSYIARDDKGNYLDTTKLLKDFTLDRAERHRLDFYRAIGFNFTDAPEIVANIKNYSVAPFYEKIQALAAKSIRIDSINVIIDKNEKQGLQSLATWYNRLLKLESTYSDVISNFMVTNAENNTQFEHMLNNTLTVLTNGINSVKTYQELLEIPHLAHLDINEYKTDYYGGVIKSGKKVVSLLNPNYNPGADGSIMLRSIFHLEESDRGTKKWGTKRKHAGRDVTIKLVNLSGVLLQKENDVYGDGIASASADPYTKVILDVHLALAGYPELMRHSDKATSFGIAITGPLVGHGSNNKHLNQNFIPINKFGTGAYKTDILDRLLPHIIGEMKFIRKMKNLGKEDIENYDFHLLKEGQKFQLFDDMLITSKDALMKIIDSDEQITIELLRTKYNKVYRAINDDVQKYFDVEYERFDKTFGEAPFISATVSEKQLMYIAEENKKEALLRFHVYNNWIYNVESIALLYGNLASYNHVKEEFHKRNASVGSTGTIYRADNIMKDMINNILYPSSYTSKNAGRLGITNRPVFTGQLKTAIVEDKKIISVYKEKYTKWLGKELGNKYGENLTEADGQGFITLDAYRQLKYAEGTWLEEHEKLYQTIIENPNKNVSAKDVEKFFPVLKLQYSGPIQTENGAVTGFHKFSLLPMIPSVIKDKNMRLLHDRMIKENISYLTFESGSKIGTVTKKGELDKLYIPGTRTLDPGITENIEHPFNEDYKPYFTPNVIHIQYLKDQLEIHDTYKNSTVFSTQLRKLVEEGLMENGVPTDFKSEEVSTTPQRIIKEYPNKINLPDKLGTVSTKKLLEIKKVFLDTSDENTLKDRSLGDLEEYGMTDKQYKFAKANIDLLNKIFNAVYDNVYNATEGTLEQDRYTTFPEWIDFLLKGQERIIDTNQLDIYGEPAKPTGIIVEETSVTSSTRIEQWNTLTEAQKLKASPNYTLLKKFEGDIGKLTKIAKNKLLKDINWTSTIVNGEEVLTGDIKNLSRLVKDELDRHDVGDHGLNFIEIATSGSIKDLSTSLNVEQIEKTLNALLVKRLIRQNVHGEALIQVASTLMENLGSTTGRHFDNPTEEELVTYGSNDLPFYDEDPITGKTLAMKIKIPLANDFLYLLKAEHLDGKPIEVREGKEVDMTASIKRLNDMLQSNEWLDKDNHRQMITLTGVRIPVQSLNSMEFMEVYEFLDPSAPAIIVLPTEIVLKSGGDYDVDKLTVMMPNIALINNKPELYNSSIKTSKSEDTLKVERHTVEQKIADIDARYKDEILKAAENDKVFSTNEEEVTAIQKVSQRLDNINKEIKTLTGNLALQHRAIIREKKDYEDMRKLMAELEVIEQQLLDAYIERDNLNDTFWAYGAFFKEELYKRKQLELAPLYEERANIQRQLNSLSAKAVQNDIITDIKSILELPQNAKALLTPNDTDILKPYAKKLAETVMDYNPLDTHDGKRRTFTDKDGKVKEIISPTRVLEIGYNLYKHVSNNVGKQTLGLGAIDNTYNTLFNRIGAYMNPYIKVKTGAGKKDFTTIPQTIRLPHNTLTIDGEEVISLSNTTTVDGMKISDIISQMMNGWVDVAKDAWIFNIQGNKEISPVLLFMIQAGVPVENAVYFVSNPLIREYVKQLRLANSILAKPMGIITEEDIQRGWLPNNIARRNVLLKYGNTSRFSAKMSQNAFRTSLNKLTVDYLHEGSEEFALEDLVKRAKSKEINNEDVTIFLHFLELEDMANTVSTLKRYTNVDTKRDVSLYEAVNRLEMLENIRENQRMPEMLVDRMITDSPIGSFFIQDFQLKLIGRLIPLRNHEALNDYAGSAFTYTEAKRLFGTKESTIVKWKSDLINFIFQNELRYFNVENLTHYRSMPITSEGKPIEVKAAALARGAFVKDAIVYLDKDVLNTQYRRKQYKGDDYTKQGLALVPETTFTNREEYFHFVLERETLRSQRPIIFLKDSTKFKYYKDAVKSRLKKEVEDEEVISIAYEEYLRDEALYRIFNHYQLFKSPHNYAQEFIRIKKDYPILEKHFSLMKALTIKKGKGSENLSLDISPLNKDQKNILYENIYGNGNSQTAVDSLTNITSLRRIMPEVSEQELNEIIDFFKNFSIYAFLQSGMGTRGKLDLTPIISQREIYRLLSEPLQNFKEILDKSPHSHKIFLDGYTAAFKKENRYKEHRERGKQYFKNFSFLKRNRKSLRNYILSVQKLEHSKELEITDTNNTYNSQAVTADNVNKIIESNPDTVFVYNFAIDNQTNANHEDFNFNNVKENVVGIGTLLNYTSTTQIKDVDGKVNPKAKVSIDNAIAELIRLRDEEHKKIRFSSNGYGLTMLGADVRPTKLKKTGNEEYDDNIFEQEKLLLGARYADKENYTIQRGVTKSRVVARETFRYLSEQLFEHFGYENPGWRETVVGRQMIQKKQAITDEEITKILKEDMTDYMKTCKL